ncbi:MAG: hypothetical protein ACFE9S_20725 [Candidatus Hermodarchaeota archaeon]
MYRRDSANYYDKQFGFALDKISNSDCRFHAIYFVDSFSGSLLLSKRYTAKSSLLSEDLISNFLIALNLFIKEINEDTDEEIQDINFRETRILYERRGRLIVIAITKKTNLQIERGILQEIVEDFYIKYKNYINTFKGIIDPALLKYKEKLERMNLNSFFKLKINF